MVAPLVGSFQPKAITGGATFHNTAAADGSPRLSSVLPLANGLEFLWYGKYNSAIISL
jgi:hypothetical protein